MDKTIRRVDAAYIGKRPATRGNSSLTSGKSLYTFRASDETADRLGTVITATGWQLDHYRANPVVLDTHDDSSIMNILGHAAGLRATAAGLEVDISFNATPRGELARQLVEAGDLRAVSVGFMPIRVEQPARSGAPVRIVEKELYEISVVPIPGNPNALKLYAAPHAGDGAPRRQRHEVPDDLQPAARIVCAALRQMRDTAAAHRAWTAARAGMAQAADGLAEIERKLAAMKGR